MNLFFRICLFVVAISLASGQDMWKYFTPDDFAKRRSAVMDNIGDGVAVLLGPEETAEMSPDRSIAEKGIFE